jgi:hypothetical protein
MILRRKLTDRRLLGLCDINVRATTPPGGPLVKPTLKRSSFVLVLAAFLSLTPLRSEAAALLPGGTSVVPDLAAALAPGTLLDYLISPFVTNTGSITGALSTAVYRNSTGTLDYYYQVSSNSTSTTNISGVSGFNFGSAPVNVQYRTDAFGIFSASTSKPLTASRAADGSEVFFWFGPPWTGYNKIAAGETSSVLMIGTNSTQYMRGGSLVQNSGWVVVPAFQPVPEPSSIALALIGLVGSFGVRRQFA